MCPPPLKGARTFGSGYFDEALMNLPTIIDQAHADLASKRFDTLVGTGVSGTIVVPALALAMDKNFLIVRKDNDDSHHGGDAVGQLGTRWVFVDDFVSTGDTRKRVMEKVKRVCTEGLFRHTTTFGGQYMYVYRTWSTAREVRADQKAKDEYRARVEAGRIELQRRRDAGEPEAW